MNETSNGAELVEQWRNDGEQDNPVGPLFAAGEFAETDSLWRGVLSGRQVIASNRGKELVQVTLL